MKLRDLNPIGVAMLLPTSFVTPAKAGVHLRRLEFARGVIDSRLCGNDEFGCGGAVQ